MMQIQKGQRFKLADLLPGGAPFSLGIRVDSPLAIDFSCFGLNAAGKLSDDRYMIFFNQIVTPCGGVRLAAPSGDPSGFAVAPAKLPDSIDRLVITAAIDGEGVMSQIRQGYVRIVAENGSELGRFNFTGSDFVKERALMVLEIYRKSGEWRVCAPAQGFDGGLEALVRHFGGEVSAAPEPAPPPRKPPVNLSKITLEKRGQAVSLEKRGGNAHGEVVINLNWHRGSTKKGLFGGFGGNQGIDLDLGCLFELREGGKGCVQALGNSFGALQQPPFIQLDADDRTGASAGGENLRINGAHWDDLVRVLVYAFIYEGVPNWSQTDAIVTLRSIGQPDIEIRLDSHDNRRTCCAIALLQNQGGQIRISKEIAYFPSQIEMDQTYHWGMRWGRGSK